MTSNTDQRGPSAEMRERIEAVKRLRLQDLTYKEIGGLLGISQTAAYRAGNYAKIRKENHARNEQKRAWERASKVPCDLCGALRGRYNRTGLCQACQREIRGLDQRIRWTKIEELWEAGWKLREIAELLGISRDYLGVEIDKMRKAGRDVPYRYDVERRTNQASGREQARLRQAEPHSSHRSLRGKAS